jgi:hypothetical protein
MQHSEELAGVCDNVTSSLSHDQLDKGDQVFRISLRNPDRLEAPILSYSCVPRLRPMPLVSQRS